MTEPSISTGAGVFDAIVAGPPEGRPVLLLHGFPQTGLVWHRQISTLAAHGYRVVAPDQRGYSPGARPQRPEDYRISLLVDDVVAISEELGWAAFDLVGHDWGGAVAWWTAHAHPGRVRTLTVVSTPHPGALATTLRTDQEQRKRSHYMIDWRDTSSTEGRMLAHDAQELRDLYAGKVPHDSVEAYVRHLSQPGALTATLNWYRAAAPTARSESSTCPRCTSGAPRTARSARPPHRRPGGGSTGRTGSRPSKASATGSPRRRPKR